MHQLGDTLDQPCLLHLIRNFGDHHLVLPTSEIFRFPFCPDPEAAPACRIGLRDRAPVLNQHAARREIRPRHKIDELGNGGIRGLEQMGQGIGNFTHIVGRNAAGHADRNPGRAIGQEVREIRRQDERLAALTVIGVAEIDRIVIDTIEQSLGDLGHPGFGVTHGRRVIAVHIAKISLPVDQRVADGKLLRQTHQRIVNRLIAMGMIFTHHIADDPGAFLVALIGIQLELAHRMQKPPMHRLQPVAHIRQRTGHDRGQRITQIALAERVLERFLAYPATDNRHFRNSSELKPLVGLAPDSPQDSDGIESDLSAWREISTSRRSRAAGSARSNGSKA